MADITYPPATNTMTTAKAMHEATPHHDPVLNTSIGISTNTTIGISISATSALPDETKQLSPPTLSIADAPLAARPAPVTHVIKSHTNTTTVSNNSSLSSEPSTSDNSKDSYLHCRDTPIDGTSNALRSDDVKGAKDDDWGWYDNDHNTDHGTGSSRRSAKAEGRWIDNPLIKGPVDMPAPCVNGEQPGLAVTAPTYVLEESRSTQNLWKQTAGNRPPQPVEDRAYFEMIWAQNFARSQVAYDMPLEILTASSPISLSPFADNTFADDEGNGDCTNYNLAADFNTNVTNRIGGTGVVKNDDREDPCSLKSAEADAAEATLIHGILRSAGAGKQNYTSLKSLGPHHHHHTLVNKKVKGTGSGGDLTVLVRGDNVFGTTVSKSFAKPSDSVVRGGNDTVSISIASYRVVESKKHGKYAQYLVIYCEGSFRDTVGVWKRYSDFAELSRKISATQQECHPLSITEDGDTELLPNALTSWRLLKKRQRWYRCLDAGYLSLKVFLLERFLHDILFESSDPQILRDFVGVDAVGQFFD